MPRTCQACSHADREAIDTALAKGEPLRNIAKRVSLSPAGLLRHKSHVAAAIVQAREHKEESLGNTIFDEIRRVQGKALDLLVKMESQGDYRGAIVAAREARECLVSLSTLLSKAEVGSGGITVIVEKDGGVGLV
jgi:hypothetical protein